MFARPRVIPLKVTTTAERKRKKRRREGMGVEDTISQRSAEILMTLLNPPRFELLRLARDTLHVAGCNREEATEGRRAGKYARTDREGA